LLSLNPAFETVTGWPHSVWIGMPFAPIIHPDDLATAIDLFKHTLAGNQPPIVELRVLTRDGGMVVGEFNAAPQREGGAVVGVMGVARDITERKQAEEQIRHLAYYDALTGLPNRASFTDSLTLAVAQARRKRQALTVMFLDIDSFKLVNDTMGHAMGDELLRVAAKRLTGLMREGDTVARAGGDEFTLLLPDGAGVAEATGIAERILEALRRPWQLDGHEFHLTASIGIAIYPDDGTDAIALLRNADTAMYRAKDQGRDNFKLFTEDMNTKIVERVALESDLRRGLERGEFVVYYQPQVKIDSGQVAGVEALVRWQHPERGLVFPMEFIPLAEETGLIQPLGEWVLRAACAQARAWQVAGLPAMRMGANISSRQFQLPDLPDIVARVLEETGLDAEYLQLEITEGVAMQATEFTVAMLRELKTMGVQISIDDFGTGHSSLAYLKHFPVDAVKIDRSFVRDLTVDPYDAAICETVITLAHSLGLGVVAEGVETKKQLAFLKARKCDEMQGYLFSEAVPPEMLETILVRQKTKSQSKVLPVIPDRLPVACD
ncbi:MAG: EAL domain-containing protein, partial [Chloroflexota bacterium]